MFPDDLGKMSWRTKFKLVIMNFLVKIAYAKNKPKVIAVTGSMSKSSTVNFIYQMLDRFNPGKVDTNLNLDPTDKSGLHHGARHRILKMKRSRNIWGSFINFLIALRTIFLPSDKSLYVFEFRSQRRGRIKFATQSLKPQIGVLTWIVPAHTEYFGTLDKVFAEKSSLIKVLPADGHAILNFDDERVRMAKKISRAPVLFYGLNPKADLWASNLSASANGLAATVHYEGQNYPLNAKAIINRHHIYPLMAAISTLVSLDYPVNKIVAAAKNLKPMGQRSNIEKGINGSRLINETFNANPESVRGALETLGDVAGGNRRIAVLGDMLEQGEYLNSGHEEVGKIAAKKVDRLILVGENSRIIARSAEKNGLAKNRIHWFSNSQKAGEFLKTIIKKNDFVLFKGSNSMKMGLALAMVREKRKDN